MKGKIQVGVVGPAKEIGTPCPYCGREISRTRGVFQVGVIMKEPGVEFKFLLCQQPGPVCCGQGHNDVVKNFKNQEEAGTEARELLQKIQLQNGFTPRNPIKGLRLLDISVQAFTPLPIIFCNKRDAD